MDRHRHPGLLELIRKGQVKVSKTDENPEYVDFHDSLDIYSDTLDLDKLLNEKSDYAETTTIIQRHANISK